MEERVLTPEEMEKEIKFRIDNYNKALIETEEIKRKAEKCQNKANRANKLKEFFFSWPQKTKFFKKLIPDLENAWLTSFLIHLVL